MADTTKTELAAKWTELRKPFPDDAVGKLVKPTISNEDWKKLPKSKCSVCGGYHPLQNMIHLDFVGHANVTDRLNSVDPNWTWEPMATTENGLPLADKEGNLWIKLTVLGVTRPGVGDGKNMKERIGDAIRNGAMRFGVALNLWSKEELESSTHHPDDKDGTPPATTEAPPAEEEPADAPVPASPSKVLSGEQVAKLLSLAKMKGAKTKEDATVFINGALLTGDFTTLDPEHFDEYKAVLSDPKVTFTNSGDITPEIDL
jgi:hypothetical protein